MITRASRFVSLVLALLSLVTLAVLAGCASGPPPRATRPTSAARAPQRDTWTALSWEDRHDLMTFTLLPNMGRMFQRFHGSADPELTCRTCHGTDADAVQFAMPHGLPALDPAHLPDAHDSDPQRARMAQFMTEQVTPALAHYLGKPLRAEGTPNGVSCFSCHPSAVQP